MVFVGARAFFKLYKVGLSYSRGSRTNKDFQTFLYVCSLDKTNAEESLLDQLISEKIYRVTLSDFAKRLQLPEKNVATIKLFNLFSSPSPQITQDDLIDLRDYLLCALYLITLEKPKIQLVEMLFKVKT